MRTHPKQKQAATWDCFDCANISFAPEMESGHELPHKAPPPSLSSSTGWGLHSVAKQGEACRRCHAKELFVGQKVEIGVEMIEGRDELILDERRRSCRVTSTSEMVQSVQGLANGALEQMVVSCECATSISSSVQCPMLVCFRGAVTS